MYNTTLPQFICFLRVYTILLEKSDRNSKNVIRESVRIFAATLKRERDRSGCQ